jgi:NitT/TauT family transport system substrate-binding protein
MSDPEPAPGRRHFLSRAGLAMATALIGPGLMACSRREPPLRIATNTWPGYELLYLARERGYFDDQPVRMVEMPSNTASLQALAAGTVEGAGLTLDETLSAIADGIDLRVVAVLDVSRGADVLLARPDLTDLAALRGRRIGVEQSAVGALMLVEALQRAGLRPDEVEMVPLAVNEHRDRFLKGQVDALITFEPVTSQLAPTGARILFSSADIPDQIIDVLALRPAALKNSPKAVRALIAGHFKARADWLRSPADAAPIMARRLGLAPADVPAAFHGLDLPDPVVNLAWLSGTPPRLETAAGKLNRVMLQARLLPRAVPVNELAVPDYLGNL